MSASAMANKSGRKEERNIMGNLIEDLNVYGGEEAVIQNLKDAGCTQDTIDCCISCMQQGKKKELLKRLEEHREGILDKVHKEEKRIDCLDYLVYQIRCCTG